MPPEQAKAGALRLVELMDTTTDVGRATQLGEALGGLGDRLPAESARAVALRLVELMGRARNYQRLSALGEALGRLRKQLPGEQAKAGALHLMNAMEHKSGSVAELATTLSKLGDRLPAEQAYARRCAWGKRSPDSARISPHSAFRISTKVRL